MHHRFESSRHVRVFAAFLSLATAAWSLTGSATVGFAATFTVDDDGDAVDESPGDGVCATGTATCTLRAAVQEANALAGADAIGFSQDPDFTGHVTLTLAGGGEDAGATGDLDVSGDLTIEGIRQGYLGSIVDAASLDRVFDVHSGTLTMHTLYLTGGSAPAGENGGAIRNQATLVASGLEFWGNSASGDGGGLYNAGDADCSACRFAYNTAPTGDGGAIANDGTLDLDVHYYSPGVVSNSALRGGGIYNSGTLTVLRNGISSNHATGGAGGGLLNDVGASALLTNLEVSGNTATSGAEGIENLGSVGLRHTTIAAHGTLGLRNDDIGAATTSVESSALADACSGTVASTGYNATTSCTLTGDATGNHIGVDLGLIAPDPCPPGQEGNPLTCPWFYRPGPGSVLVDGGKPGGCVTPLGSPMIADPRGVLRPVGNACDIGGIEMTPACVPPAMSIKNVKLIVRGLNQEPGQQKVSFSGDVSYPAAASFPWPIQFGGQIAIDDLGTGTSLLNRSQTIGNPIEAFGSFPASCHEWRDKGVRSRYRERDSGCQGTPPLGGVVKKLMLTDRHESKGEVQVRFSVTDTTFAEPIWPIRVSYTFGKYAHMSTGTCAAVQVESSDCLTSGAGTLICRIE